MANSVFIKRIRVVKQAFQLLLLLLAMTERWRGGGLLRQGSGAARSLMRMMHSEGVGQQWQTKVKLHTPSQPRGAAPHPRRVCLPLNAGTSSLEERDVLTVPSNDTSRVSVGFFSATHEGPPPDLGQ